jgi:WD40 repeat protein
MKYKGHDNEVLTLDVFSMDGNVFATGSSDLSFRVWDIRTKKPCFRVFDKNSNGVSQIKFMPENINTLAVGYEDGSIKLWDLRAAGKVGKLFDGTYAGLKGIQFSLSGRLLFAAYNSNVIKIWDLLKESKVGEMQSGQTTNVIKSISLSENGSCLLSASKDGRIQKWVLAK